MRVSDLLRCKVVTESGEKLGHVFDVRVARARQSSAKRDDQAWRLTGLVVGRRGALERFGFVRGGELKPRHGRDAIDWSQVVRIEDGTIIVRGVADPRAAGD